MENKAVTLDRLLPGEDAVVTELCPTSFAPRLAELGFIEGAHVRCVHRSPGGGISAYLVCGATVALRREDASSVKALRWPK